jgi:hypothetical protein
MIVVHDGIAYEIMQVDNSAMAVIHNIIIGG